MASFDAILSQIHDKSVVTSDSKDESNVIVIDSKRQFTLPAGFDAVIAYEGDIHSQIVTFKCPKYHEGHDLSVCANKKIKWKNLGSGAEGVSDLVSEDCDDQSFYLAWEVTPNVCTSYGAIELSIEIYDSTDGYKAFSWNTPAFTGLSVGKTIDSVGTTLPPKNEILTIDKDTKNIFAPAGYNNTICTYGEVGVTEVYFLVDRYIGKNDAIDVLEDKVRIYISMNGAYGIDDDTQGDIVKQSYSVASAEKNSNDLVLITWKVPAGVTAGKVGPGTMEIMFEFYTDTLRWLSGTYKSLNIGHNLFETNHEEGEEWDLLESYVESIIENYIANNDFIIDAN